MMELPEISVLVIRKFWRSVCTTGHLDPYTHTGFHLILEESNWILRSMGFGKTKPKPTKTKQIRKVKNKNKLFLSMHSTGCMWLKSMFPVYWLFYVSTILIPKQQNASYQLNMKNEQYGQELYKLKLNLWTSMSWQS